MESTNKNVILPVRGMHCSSCANIITKRLKKLPGITDASVNIATEQASVSFDPNITSVPAMNNEISPLGYSMIDTQSHSIHEASNQSKPENHMNHGNSDEDMDSSYNEMQLTIPFSLLIFFIMLWEISSTVFLNVPPVPVPMPFFTLILSILSSVILFGPGMQFIRAIGRFITYRVANMDTLIGIGTLVAYSYSMVRILFPQTMSALGFDEIVYFDVVIVVIGVIKLGKYLEIRSKRSTGEALKKLMQLQAKTAIVKRGSHELEIPIEDVLVGDIVLVKPGSTIPLDGDVLAGESAVDESMVTGESLPVDVIKGSHVIGATMNMQGSLSIRVTRAVGDTVLSRIMTMVSEAQGSKAAIEKIVDKVSGIFVPSVLGIAFVSVLVWIGVGSLFMPISQAIVYAITACVGILVIACPCALGLATPTAIIVAVGRAAGLGILIKDADSLEKLHSVTAIVMDKTGTITHGKPVITDIQPLGKSTEQSLMNILASLEAHSEHPLAHAITSYATQHNIVAGEVKKFTAVGGRGVHGEISSVRYMAGNAAYMQESGVDISKHESSAYTNQGKTPLYVAKGTTPVGVVYVADSVKEDAAASVAALKKLGIEVIMATGDEKNTAEYIASQVGISRVESHVDPKKKFDIVRSLQQEGYSVAMVGDGINDAPAIAAADVGIAMSTGTDVAISTANITLLHGDIAKLTHAISLSKKTMQIIKENLFWAFIYNVVGIPLAAGILYPFTGVFLSPAFAGLAMAGSSVSVVTNSLRLKKIRIY